jgi:hypothetical protein
VVLMTTMGTVGNDNSHHIFTCSQVHSRVLLPRQEPYRVTQASSYVHLLLLSVGVHKK